MAEIISFAARALFRILLPTYVRTGVSMNFMIRDAKRLGISFRRSDMLGEIRYFQNWFKFEALTSKLPKDTRVPPHLMSEVNLTRSAKYRAFGEATYEHPITGATFTKDVSMYDDTRRNPIGYEEKMIEEIEEDPSQAGWNLVDVRFRVVEHNQGWSY